MGETVLPWDSPFEADRCKLGAILGPVMALLSCNPSYRPSIAEFVDSCTAILAANNMFACYEVGTLQPSGQGLEDSDHQVLGPAVNDTDHDIYGSSMDDVSEQSTTRTLELSQSLPLQDEIL
jgi:hypothetical protein